MGVNARFTKVGINKATSGSWGTGTADATACGAGDGHYVRDDLGIQLQMQQNLDDSAGQNFHGACQSSNAEAITAAIPMYLHYNDVWQNILWGLTLGTGGTAPTIIGTSTAYTNTFEPATNKTGSYATIIRDKVQYISEVPGAKFTGFELTVGENGRMEITWNATGDLEKENSTINTATQVSALTFPILGLRAFFDDAVIRINTQGGGALGTSDAHTFTGMRLRYTQSLDTKHVGGQTTLIEPEEDQFPECELELTFARLDAQSDDYQAGHRNTTKYKADLTLTGAAIDATSNYGLLFQFPHVYVSRFAAPIPGGAGQSAPTMTLRALSTTTAPTGMTSVTLPMRIVTTGIASANPFA